jgi:hypothetical protein
MLLIKLIYWLFERQFNKVYFSKQSKKKGFENMKKVFVDSNGKPYYTVENDFDMPYERVKAIEICVLEIMAGLDNSEMILLREKMKKALNGGHKADIAMIGHCIIEWERREEMLLHPTAMFNMVAYKYIREDEDPAVIDKEIHRQKVAQLRKDSKEGLYDFFYRAGMHRCMPYLTKLESEWDELWQTSEIKIRVMNQHLTASLSEQELLTK